MAIIFFSDNNAMSGSGRHYSGNHLHKTGAALLSVLPLFYMVGMLLKIL